MIPLLITYNYYSYISEDFKRDLLSADLDDGDLRKLEDEASHMYRVFCRPGAPDYIDIGQHLLDQFRQRMFTFDNY